MRHTGMGILLLACFAVFAAGCQTAPREAPEEESGYAALHQSLKKEQAHLRRARDKEQASLEHAQDDTTPDGPLAPVAPEFNPLEETQVSISVNNRPLHDVLYVIARDAGLNLVIAPGISLDNRVTISFEQTPASVVVDKLLHAYDLAWKVEDNVLAVERFQEEVFSLDFLNANTKVSIESGGDIFGNADPESGSNDLTGNFGMQSSFGSGVGSDTLYGFLKANLQEILSAKDAAGENGGHFVLDPTAGTLYVQASPRKMDVVRSFVHKVQDKLAQQVVIDAQILEVSLSDSFQLGVDWGYVAKRLIRGYEFDINLGWQSATGFGTYNLDSQDPQPLVIQGNENTVDNWNEGRNSEFQSTIQALETFGTVSVVSNPHIRTRHAQPALVTSGTTQNYIKEIERETDNDDGTTSVSTDTATAFEGVMLGVVPFITDNGAVDLNIFPITSQVDLSESVTVGQDQITLPKVDVRNVNTNVRVNGGDTVILGGLIQKDKHNTDRGTPGVSKVPGLGWLFKNRNDTRQLSELVVVMHVRVL